jgi:hypothetical protein
MIAGGNWWRANEIVMHHLTGQSDTRYRSRDNAAKCTGAQKIKLGPTDDALVARHAVQVGNANQTCGCGAIRR